MKGRDAEREVDGEDTRERVPKGGAKEGRRNLAPGSYSVQVSGPNGSTGVALVEVYEVP